jgi:hypothetical protein
LLLRCMAVKILACDRDLFCNYFWIRGMHVYDRRAIDFIG